MSIEKNDIDELFRQNLADEQVPFDEAAWVQVQTMIPKKKPFLFSGKGFLMIGAIICTITVILLWPKNETKTTEQLIESEIVKSSSEERTVFNEIGVANSVTGSKNTRELRRNIEFNLQTHSSDLSSTNDSKSSLKDNPVKSIKNESNFSPKDNFKNDLNTLQIGNKAIEKNNNNSNERSNLFRLKIDAIANRNSKFLAKLDQSLLNETMIIENFPSEKDAISTNLNPHSHNSEDEKIINSKYNQLTLIELNEETKLLSSIDFKSFESSMESDKNHKPKDFTKLNHRNILFNLKIFGGMGIPISSSYDYAKGDYIQTHKERSSTYAGVALEGVYKNMGLEIGLQNHNYKYDETITNFETDLVFDTSHTSPTREFPIVTEHIDTTYIKSDRRVEVFNENTRYNIVQIPIRLSYSFHVNQLSLKPTVGALLSLPSSKQISIYNLDSESTKLVDLPSMKNNIDLTAGLGIGYKLNTRLGLELETNYLINQKSITSLDHSFSSNRLITRIGLSFRIK